jgi:exopolyphosphatase/guanosine-5'-triphosphate,3'-diphosphate pyrophosphatase
VQAILPPIEVERAVGVAGTVAQLALLAGTDDLPLQTIEGLLDELASRPLAERERVPKLDPKRAPVIVGGALIVREVLQRYGLERIRFSVRDLLDGAALEAASLPAPLEGSAPPGAYTCC